MRIGSLFAGIGGLELGLENAGTGRVTWQVEIDPWCREVLRKHWPDAKRYEDVNNVGSHNLERVDLICGGFPCQDVSSAGARKGLVGERSGLWFQYLRIVNEVRPRWVVVENVASGATRWVDQVISGLEQLGYSCVPFPVRADSLGAPYCRARIFIVARLANANSSGEHLEPFDAEMARAQQSHAVSGGERSPSYPDGERLRNHWSQPMPPVVRMVPGPSERMARRAAGNCVVPQCAEVIGHIVNLLEHS